MLGQVGGLVGEWFQKLIREAKCEELRIQGLGLFNSGALPHARLSHDSTSVGLSVPEPLRFSDREVG